jgi:hypothetical protein
MKSRGLALCMALAGLVVVVGFIFEIFAGQDQGKYIILGHGEDTSAKVFSFIYGWLSGCWITTAWYLFRSGRGGQRTGSKLDH